MTETLVFLQQSRLCAKPSEKKEARKSPRELAARRRRDRGFQNLRISRSFAYTANPRRKRYEEVATGAAGEDGYFSSKSLNTPNYRI